MHNPVFRILALTIFVSLLSPSLQGHVDRWYNSLGGEEIVLGEVLEVQEGLYGYPGGLEEVVGSRGLVRLRYDYESAEVFSGGSGYLEVDVQANWGGDLSIVTLQSDFTLRIDLSTGEISDVAELAGARWLKLVVKDIRGPLSGALQAGVHIFLEGEIETERYFRMDKNVPDPAQYRVGLTVPGVSLGEFRWSYVFGAEYYELEWVVLDDAASVLSSNLSSVTADFQEASRLQVKETFYELTLAYPQSVVVYRVRPVYLAGADGVGVLHYGPWSTDPIAAVGNVDEVPLGQSLSNSDYYYQWSGFEPDKNWQFSRVYAEWGKSKEVLVVADGILQSRQTVTRLHSEDRALVSEQLYDYEGRPSVQLLPHPVDDRELKYYHGLHAKSGGQNFGRDDFDTEVATGATPSMTHYHQPQWSGGTGASAYYSSSNSFLNSSSTERSQRYWEHYLPESGGFAYTRTIYTDDATGRVRMQSGVGEVFQLEDPRFNNDGHQTQFYYTGTNSGELSRLFGKEVGDASHYNKELIVDGNGQIAVSYKDMHGRVIATALAGETPDNLQALVRSPQVIEGKIPLDLPQDKTVLRHSSSSHFAVSAIGPPAPTYTLTYGLFGKDFEETCANFCVNCSYRIRFQVLDPEGDPVQIQSVTATAAGSIGFPLTTTAAGYRGLYTLPADGPSIELVFDPTDVVDDPCSVSDKLAGWEVSFEVFPSQVGNYTVVREIWLPEDQYALAQAHFDSTHNYCGQTFTPIYDITECTPGCLQEMYLLYNYDDQSISRPSPLPDSLYQLVANWYQSLADTSSNPAVVTKATVSIRMADVCDDGSLPATGTMAAGASNSGDVCVDQCNGLLQGLVADVSIGGQYYLEDDWYEENKLQLDSAQQQYSTLVADFDLRPSGSWLSASQFRTALQASSHQQLWIDSVLVKSHPEYCHYTACQEEFVLESCRFNRWLSESIDGTNYTSSLSYPHSNGNHHAMVAGGSGGSYVDPWATTATSMSSVDPLFVDLTGTGIALEDYTHSGSSSYLEVFRQYLEHYPDGVLSNTQSIVDAAESAAGSTANQTIDSYAEWEYLRDMYRGLKQTFFAHWKENTQGCPYILAAPGNTPSYLDGKLIRVPDPTFGTGLGYSQNGLPQSGQSSVQGALCGQQCQQAASAWSSALQGCLTVVHPEGQDATYTIGGLSYTQSGLGSSFGSPVQSFIEWVLYGGSYVNPSTNTTYTIGGLIASCEANCASTGNFMGCLPAGTVEATLDTVALPLFTTDDLSHWMQNTASGSSSWLDLLKACAQIPGCYTTPYHCDCERFNLSNPIYGSGTPNSLQAFLSYHGMSNPPLAWGGA